MIINMFNKNTAVIPAAPIEPIPDHAKARNLNKISIEKLRSRSAVLKSRIEKDSAELRENDLMLEALIEADAKVTPVELDVDQDELEAELFGAAAE